ncbi:MAG: YceI family protein [Candidatus Acidiferrales bacterium]
MNKKILAVFLLLVLPTLARADSQWILQQATLAYDVSHPLHQVEGVSHAARGKGICHAGECNFLIAVPVKSFDSGNGDRDLHMLQITRAGEFPLVTVRFQLPETALASPTIHADLQVQFGGQTAEYKQVPFRRVTKGSDIEVLGTIPLRLSDFKIPRPELLAMPIKNEVPVKVDATWRKM